MTAELVADFTRRLPQMLEDIRTLVECESPSEDLAATAAAAEAVANLGHRILGVEAERIVIDGRTHLRWMLSDDLPKVLMLGHYDTVWPIGTLDSIPFSLNDGTLRGPGCFDMKVGVVMALHAAAALGAEVPVAILITGDEEIGSGSSRRLIEDTARGTLATLVLEASADNGALKSARKGASIYEVSVTGRAAHAGLEPHLGVNAVVELAHQVTRIAALGSVELGTSVVPTAGSGGTTTNTVPAAANVAVDVRAWSAAEQERVDRELRALTPVLPGALVHVNGGPDRPPMEAAASAKLFALAQEAATALGLEPLTSAEVGGCSDGNFTAGIGVPTLDGLGAVGGGAHAENEHVLVAEIPLRAALLTALVTRLIEPGTKSGS
ncbi:M20 family metallopeptidase [Paenarthrobacter sp. NPDC056912]|uniref:M20 family metallopeptidase n=1 Tax=Paenarthrobacter sp. NPDC056912 TaxID=3345965 RepID=UPI00366DEFD6